MRKLRLAAVAIGMVVSTWSSGSNAVAADMPVKAPTISTPSWTGFYVGASVGARVAENDWKTTNIFPAIPNTSIDNNEKNFGSAAARFGAYIGNNWSIAPRWIAGIEGYVGFANNKNAINPFPGTMVSVGPGVSITDGLPNGSIKESWDGGIRSRLGYLVTPRTMIYATGGVNWMRARLEGECHVLSFCTIEEGVQTASKTMVGWTVGAGLEYRMTGNWIARLDYQYADYGSFSHPFFSNGFAPGAVHFDDRATANAKIQTHTATVGVGYKF